MKGTTLAEEGDDPLLAKHRAKRKKAVEQQQEEQTKEITTMKKFQVSVTSLQRVRSCAI